MAVVANGEEKSFSAAASTPAGTRAAVRTAAKDYFPGSTRFLVTTDRTFTSPGPMIPFAFCKVRTLRSLAAILGGQRLISIAD